MAGFRRPFEALDYEKIARLMMAEDDPAAEEAVQMEAERFEASALKTMVATLRDSGWYPRSRINQFTDRFAEHRRFHEITEDLGDDGFVIKVTMPGIIVGDNGESANGSTVTWTFSGAMLRDRDLELMVTSRLD